MSPPRFLQTGDAAGEAAGIKHTFVCETCPLFPLYSRQKIPGFDKQSETRAKGTDLLFPLFISPIKGFNLKKATVAGVQFALTALILTFSIFCNPSNAL